MPVLCKLLEPGQGARRSTDCASHCRCEHPVVSLTSIHSLIHSLTHSPTHIHSLTNSPTHSPTHSLTHSFTNSLTHPLTHSHLLIQTISLSLGHIQYLSNILHTNLVHCCAEFGVQYNIGCYVRSSSKLSTAVRG